MWPAPGDVVGAPLDADIERDVLDADLDYTIDIEIAAAMLDARYVGMGRQEQRRRLAVVSYEAYTHLN